MNHSRRLGRSSELFQITVVAGVTKHKLDQRSQAWLGLRKAGECLDHTWVQDISNVTHHITGLELQDETRSVSSPSYFKKWASCQAT